jgi:predicted 3-demethylubiquinone-9 3-methyltransferase (glyoxalase superfamily)
MARVVTTEKTSAREQTRRTRTGKVTTYLTFKDQAEEAMRLYTSLIPNSRIVEIQRSEGGPVPKGKVLHGVFELDGQRFFALDGGPSFSFTEGMSLYIDCDTQEEVDELWEKLSAGGEKGPCGWLKDRFGVSWQVIPSRLGELITDSEHGNSKRAIEAMLKMSKIDIATLERAYAQKD